MKLVVEDIAILREVRPNAPMTCQRRLFFSAMTPADRVSDRRQTGRSGWVESSLSIAHNTEYGQRHDVLNMNVPGEMGEGGGGGGGAGRR